MRHDTLSVAEVSALCGIDGRAIAQWTEEGHFPGAFEELVAGQDPKPSTVAALARAFGVTICPKSVYRG